MGVRAPDCNRNDVEEEGKAVGMRGRLPHGKGRATHLESQMNCVYRHACTFVCSIMGTV